MGRKDTNRKLKFGNCEYTNRLGLGASIPKEHEIKRQKESTNELLRKQLLGKDYKKFQSTKPSSFEAGPKLRPPTKRPAESDDEGGRSSLGRSKRPKKRPCNELQNGILLEEEEAAGTTTTIEAVDHPNPASSPPTAPRNSYLDEVLLAKKSSKRRKKNRKKKGGGVATNME